MQSLSVLSGVVFVIAFGPYVWAILEGKTKPQKASWVIWATLDTITFAGMFAKHSVNGLIVGAIIGAWVVTGLAMKYGKPGWKWIDVACLLGAVSAVSIWQVFDSPTMGLATSLIATFIGSTPTFVNAWNHPEEEDKLAWTLWWVSCVLGVIAVPSWSSPADAAQPSVFLLIESTMMFILFVKPWLIPTKK